MAHETSAFARVGCLNMKFWLFLGIIRAWALVLASPIDAGGEEVSVNIDPDSSLIIYDRTNLSRALTIAAIILLSIVLLGLLVLAICWALRKFCFKSSKVIAVSETGKRSSTYRAGDQIRQKYGIAPDGSPLPKKGKYGKYLTPPPAAVSPDR
ncbi:hypothetical protein K493DRAFT_367747 [Basidiobolus meristosporus CBS 931.73]|uniref:Uncharacterized protein n=1 Tax=Basidiobolus meristosporus CBS 931.73 TaxID=1314790 RepID=A0A1Y1YK07_9FUNG|nr:hypothetical protein K493DRAFT_367747 [Basidiobolus meristosporus CBS 931.73]|eukprot:ORX98341.1 hypothetical protein K493DRAFT_367747 [Basidiobolus meristosporus CBS 931.73]